VEFTIAAGRLLVYCVSTLCISQNVEEKDGSRKFKSYRQYISNFDGTRCEEHCLCKISLTVSFQTIFFFCMMHTLLFHSLDFIILITCDEDNKCEASHYALVPSFQLLPTLRHKYFLPQHRCKLGRGWKMSHQYFFYLSLDIESLAC
jgi:hypothetical protein